MSLFNNITGVFPKVTNAVTGVFSKATNAITEGITFTIGKLVQQVNLNETIASLEKYQRESGKDVSLLTDFIRKLQAIGEDSIDVDNLNEDLETEN